VSIVALPGLKTVSERDYAQCAKRRTAGYEWVSFQAYNQGKRDYDLAPAKSAGIDAGVWGVSYDAARFHADAKALAEQAVKLGAQHYIIDIEMAAKNTRPNRGLKPAVDGARAGGWNGPVHLNTMGPPANPDVNDYTIDLQSILETGGGVFTQAYANETDTFLPSLAVQYWTRVGVPLDRLNLTVSLYPAEADKEHSGRRYDGAKWVELLNASGHKNKRAISIFMDEAMTDTDAEALKALTLKASTPPEPSATVSVNRAAALRFLADSIAYWRDVRLAEETLQRQRQTLAWRVLNMPETRANQIALRNALDEAGAPRP
jgi:hypothetical protein